MSVPYEPPVMPPFPESIEELLPLYASYYEEGRPLDFLAEMLVVDITGELPEKTGYAIEELIANSEALKAAIGHDWRMGTRSQMRASETFDIAVLDLWYRNRASAAAAGWVYHPWHYAQNFLDNYFADGSRVDVWEGNALERARAVIAAAQAGS